MSIVLKVDASTRLEGSISRQLTGEIVEALSSSGNVREVVARDLASGLPFVDAAWIGANFTPEESRNEAQKKVLSLSDELVQELIRADIIVLGAPVHNFSVPAVLKTWIDLVCRARKTFLYTEAGPKGLLEGKQAIIAIASGGTKVGSDQDHLSSYLRHIMNFIGVEDVKFVVADQLMLAPQESLERARKDIAALF